MVNGAIRKEGLLTDALVPFLLTELRLVLEPAEERRIRRQTVAVTGRLQQLDLGDHLKLLQDAQRCWVVFDQSTSNGTHVTN